ncbi:MULTISPECIES: Ku protein [Carboxydocella]|uniref:Non-homologous end joining protein Ku n=2 Tax=Carboxydocella TaxID=178898 RepID=A0A1T4NAH6_9FIRM|nr:MULTISPECIES: Ku protein [Carboxydocella]AVX20967.1 DNA end-binding protein Ku [Carboxydocella thermautotrophica]GAW28110.1 Ku protein [Carboxydocella sp. ULO1]GAW30972.1 Ku protein [Carboxydocella sp. JDF658]SJZ76224.1 DNA end-binding protein Ku [Carboxydocella sporoproducens DSM 16521]
MRSLWKGAVSFGLVNIPVKMYVATEKKDIRFNYLHQPCHTPVQYRKYCPTCQREVEAEEIVRGYEYNKGQYVIISEEDLENIPAPTARAIEILDFVELSQIDPIYYDKTYYLAPAEGGQKPYALLKAAMEKTGKIAIAKVTIRSKEALAAVRCHQECLVLETMFYPDEIRSPRYIPELEFQAQLQEKELEMAVTLINNLAAPFDPEKYTDRYREALRQAIAAKIAGQDVVAVPAAQPAKVVDLLEALKASLELTKPQAKAAGGEG